MEESVNLSEVIEFRLLCNEFYSKLNKFISRYGSLGYCDIYNMLEGTERDTFVSIMYGLRDRLYTICSGSQMGVNDLNVILDNFDNQ